MSVFLNTKPHLTRRVFVSGMLYALLSSKTTNEAAFAAATESPKSYIDTQVEDIVQIITTQDQSRILTNKYLVSGVYYSDVFCCHLANPQNQVDVPTRIVGRVSHLLTPDVRAWAVQSLGAETTCAVSADEHRPLAHFAFGHGKNHVDAIDLFTTEGSAVLAFAGGLVLLADTGWQSGDEFSSVSMKGGNTVIVFNREKNEFYRYAHLRTVSVRPGDVVSAGQALGIVGHTGRNASLPGHGGHLHFEINTFDTTARVNRVVPAPMLVRRVAAV